MKKDEVRDLFRLLSSLCSNSPSKLSESDENAVAAWYLALKPYTYQQAKDGALAFKRQNRFYPDVSEIIAFIPKKQPISEFEKECICKLHKWHKGYVDALHNAGLPTPTEAKEKGIPFDEHIKMLNDAGFDYPGYGEETE